MDIHEETKSTRIYIDVHRKLKMEADRTGTSIGAVIEKMYRAYAERGVDVELGDDLGAAAQLLRRYYDPRLGDALDLFKLIAKVIKHKDGLDQDDRYHFSSRLCEVLEGLHGEIVEHANAKVSEELEKEWGVLHVDGQRRP